MDGFDQQCINIILQCAKLKKLECYGFKTNKNIYR